jgi:hypothetical protein
VSIESSVAVDGYGRAHAEEVQGREAGPARCALARDTRNELKAFVALRDAGALSKRLCRRLISAQDARTTIEHGYLGTSAGNVHEAAQLIRDSAREFIGAFRDWIAPYLTDQER